MIAEAKKTKTPINYLKKVVYSSCNVWYFLLDAENNIIVKSGGNTYGSYSPCFSHLFRGIPKTVVATYVYHPTNKMGYDEEAIIRYVTDLCEMGFKCEYLGVWGPQSVFRIKTEDMETKNQYCSTLTLIRCLYEDGGVTVPNYYLQAMDEHPKGNKFLALQKAHKQPNQYLGLGHNVTAKENGDNIALSVLFKRFKDENKTPFSAGGTTLNACWAGSEEAYQAFKKRGYYYK